MFPETIHRSAPQKVSAAKAAPIVARLMRRTALQALPSAMVSGRGALRRMMAAASVTRPMARHTMKRMVAKGMALYVRSAHVCTGPGSEWPAFCVW